MSTPTWFRNTQESKDSIHNRLTHLEETVKKHLVIIQQNQAIMEKNLQDLKKRKGEAIHTTQSPKIVSRKHLLEETFRESNDSIIRVVVNMARKLNPGVIPWFHQQLNRYLQLPYIPSFQTQVTTLSSPYPNYNYNQNYLPRTTPVEESSDDESF